MSLTVNPRVDDTGHVVRAIKESIMMGGEVVVKDIKENLRGIVSPLTTEITEINILGTIKGADLLGQIMKIIRLMNSIKENIHDIICIIVIMVIPTKSISMSRGQFCMGTEAGVHTVVHIMTNGMVADIMSMYLTGTTYWETKKGGLHSPPNL